MITKIKGTQDFLDLTLFNYVLKKIAVHLERYNFNQIMTPILEPTELFKRSLGGVTDVVSKEMFIIKSAKNDDAICLRPEATASTMRAFVENGIAVTPWKVFSHGPMFRYERPQKGRYREFHQVTIENIGAVSIAHDVQLIAMLDRLFTEQILLRSYGLQINFLGCVTDRAQYAQELKRFLDEHAKDLCATCKERKEKNVLRVFDCKNASCQERYKNAPIMTHHLCAQCAEEWKAVQEGLSLLSVSYVVNPQLVRGLDYYNKTVFEFVSGDLGAQNAFCAGGRYDQLAQEIGAKADYPSVGAAIGIERLLLLVAPIKEQLRLPMQPPLHIIMPLSEKEQVVAQLLADELQHAGISHDILFEGSAKSMMRKANKMGAQTVLVIGESERKKKTVSLKYMMTGTTQEIPQIEVVNVLKEK